MKIFKFGGASIKDATGVKNVANILQSEGTDNTVVVISAMGKNTNAFEAVIAVSYNTSDAADDLLCVDLGGRRIIKKKKNTNTNNQLHTR